MKVSNFAAVLLRKLFSSNTKWWGSVDAETSRAAKQALLEFAGTEVRPASPMASDDNVPVQVLLRTSDSADHSPTRSSSWVQFLFRPGRGQSFSRWSSTAFRLVLCRINRVTQILQPIWRCSEQKMLAGGRSEAERIGAARVHGPFELHHAADPRASRHVAADILLVPCRRQHRGHVLSLMLAALGS